MDEDYTHVYQAEKGKHVQMSVSEATELYQKDPQKIYSDFFFTSLVRSKQWQLVFGERIAKILNVNSIVDFGCASGYYLQGAYQAGVHNILGFEYCRDAASPFIDPSIAEYIQQGNVMEPIDCGTFDLAVCIEVAEHILPESNDIFIDNICKASQRYILFTAAVPGTKGDAHINCHPISYWQKKIEQRGFMYDADRTKQLRNECSDPEHNRPYQRYILKQMMLFVNSEQSNEP